MDENQCYFIAIAFFEHLRQMAIGNDCLVGNTSLQNTGYCLNPKQKGEKHPNTQIQFRFNYNFAPLFKKIRISVKI